MKFKMETLLLFGVFLKLAKSSSRAKSDRKYWRKEEESSVLYYRHFTVLVESRTLGDTEALVITRLHDLLQLIFTLTCEISFSR